MVCAWCVVRRLHSNALHANRLHTVAFSIRKTIGRSIRLRAGHFASKAQTNWADTWWRLVIFQRKVLFLSSRHWLSVRNGVSAKRKNQCQLSRVSVAFGQYSSINIAAPSSVTQFHWQLFLCFIAPVAPFFRCSWPACSPDCNGLSDPQLHGLECGVLCIRSVPKRSGDVVQLRDFYRSDALLTLRCLLLQWRYPERWNTIMKLESHAKQRIGTRYYT